MRARSYRSYLLLILMLSLAFNHMDRYALGLVQESIKNEFHLTDTQLGLLTGIAFSLFYSVMGIPIARWADRGNRARILSLTTTVWSGMVALSGVATNFAQLLLIRIGVSVGEAGCVPPAYSLIPDYFTRAERPRATAIYATGAGFGGVIGYFLAGWLNEFYGWRVMFMLLAVPGLVLAVVIRLTLKEPRYHGVRPEVVPFVRTDEVLVGASPLSLKNVCHALLTNVSFRRLLVCICAVFFFNSGITQWQATFFLRAYGMKTGDLGSWLALIFGGSIVGIYLGGELMSRYLANREGVQLKVMAILYLIFGPLSAALYVSPNRYLAFALMGIGAVGSNAVNGPLFAMMQTIVPSRMRAVSIAVVFLFANLIGLGLGPLAAGALSDTLRPVVGVKSLRDALLIMCLGYFCVAWQMLHASKSIARDADALGGGRDAGDSEREVCAERCH